ncbi:MAG: hypothetical protein SGJ23_12955 [Alphaproteobacteria bacterium]|nr:hypothetical protein [Alphaproteobacteria bacterium]
MFGITDKLKTAAATGGLFAVAGALALIGIVWITIAAITVLGQYVIPPVAMLIVGVALLIPLFIVVLQARTGSKDHEPVVEAPTGEYAALAKLVGAAQSLAEKSPIAGAALALGAAWFASRSPATSSLAVQIIAELVEQWSKAKPAAPQTASTEPNDPAI